MITCKPSSSFNLELLSHHSTPSRRGNASFPHEIPPLRRRCVVLSSSVDRPRWERDSGGYSSNYRVKREGGGFEFGRRKEEVEVAERRVNCEVEVISWRERRIRAEISVNADIESVWNALTDYERLADFIPNLVCSGRIPCPHPGRIWLEQRGLQRALYWHIEARVVLDLQEFPISDDERELHFSMVDGDFKKFEGKWSLKSRPRLQPPSYILSMLLRSSTTLSYEVNVIPRFNFPAIFLERIISSDLPVNLRALAFRAERNFEGNQNLAFTINSGDRAINGNGPSFGTDVVATLLNGNKVQPRELKDSIASANLQPSPSTELTTNWGVFGKVCKLDRPCVVDEVHLRRLDGLLENGGVHRCVIASITVKAPVREVWNMLTAYESLPEILVHSDACAQVHLVFEIKDDIRDFRELWHDPDICVHAGHSSLNHFLTCQLCNRIVPNLAISKILSRENNRVRILQEGCKGLLYMVLHARVILDLCEHLEQEISFEQVEGDFDSFQGKWIFEQLGNQHTLLKYTVESKMHKDSFLSEAIMEEVIYEDLPSNLCAIRDYIENKGAMTADSEMISESRHHDEQTASLSTERNTSLRSTADDFSNHNGEDSSAHRPRVPGLQSDIEVLKSEILKFVAEHGQEGFMPMRKQLRLHGRVDIEKAITRTGGFRKVATVMNLSLAYKHRKPRGYWDNLENLEEEIHRFQRSWGMDPSYMPSRKSFERAGRYDIARALEKWGGLHEVSRLLSLKVRHPNRQPGLGKDKRSVDSAAANDVESEDKSASKPYIAQDTHKWLSQLKHLDINWVE